MTSTAIFNLKSTKVHDAFNFSFILDAKIWWRFWLSPCEFKRKDRIWLDITNFFSGLNNPK